MATPRLFFNGNPGRIVLSKSGYDATNPSLAEGNKIFDSDWLFSGVVALQGLIQTSLSSGSGSFTIPFPKDLGYEPSVMAYYAEASAGGLRLVTVQPAFYWLGTSITSRVYAPIRAYSNRLEVTYPAYNSADPVLQNGENVFRNYRASMLVTVLGV